MLYPEKNLFLTTTKGKFEIYDILEHLKSLKYEDKPDYEFINNKIREMRNKELTRIFNQKYSNNNLIKDSLFFDFLKNNIYKNNETIQSVVLSDNKFPEQMKDLLKLNNNANNNLSFKSADNFYINNLNLQKNKNLIQSSFPNNYNEILVNHKKAEHKQLYTNNNKNSTNFGDNINQHDNHLGNNMCNNSSYNYVNLELLKNLYLDQIELESSKTLKKEELMNLNSNKISNSNNVLYLNNTLTLNNNLNILNNTINNYNNNNNNKNSFFEDLRLSLNSNNFDINDVNKNNFDSLNNKILQKNQLLKIPEYDIPNFNELYNVSDNNNLNILKNIIKNENSSKFNNQNQKELSNLNTLENIAGFNNNISNYNKNFSNINQIIENKKYRNSRKKRKRSPICNKNINHQEKIITNSYYNLDKLNNNNNSIKFDNFDTKQIFSNNNNYDKIFNSDSKIPNNNPSTAKLNNKNNNFSNNVVYNKNTVNNNIPNITNNNTNLSNNNQNQIFIINQFNKNNLTDLSKDLINYFINLEAKNLTSSSLQNISNASLYNNNNSNIGSQTNHINSSSSMDANNIDKLVSKLFKENLMKQNISSYISYILSHHDNDKKKEAQMDLRILNTILEYLRKKNITNNLNFQNNGSSVSNNNNNSCSSPYLSTLSFILNKLSEQNNESHEMMVQNLSKLNNLNNNINNFGLKTHISNNQIHDNYITNNKNDNFMELKNLLNEKCFSNDNNNYIDDQNMNFLYNNNYPNDSKILNKSSMINDFLNPQNMNLNNDFNSSSNNNYDWIEKKLIEEMNNLNNHANNFASNLNNVNNNVNIPFSKKTTQFNHSKLYGNNDLNSKNFNIPHNLPISNSFNNCANLNLNENDDFIFNYLNAENGKNIKNEFLFSKENQLNDQNFPKVNNFFDVATNNSIQHQNKNFCNNINNNDYLFFYQLLNEDNNNNLFNINNKI